MYVHKQLITYGSLLQLWLIIYWMVHISYITYFVWTQEADAIDMRMEEIESGKYNVPTLSIYKESVHCIMPNKL